MLWLKLRKKFITYDAKKAITGVNVNLGSPIVAIILNNDIIKPMNKKIIKHNILIKVGFKNSLIFIRIDVLDNYINFCK